MFFLAVMAGAGYYVFMKALDGGDYVKVPDIAGLPITEAAYLITEQRLELGKQTQVPDPAVPQYHVIAQRPAAGRVVRTGRKVYPTVSIGADMLITPDLRRKRLSDARRELASARFHEGGVARIPHASPRDTVIGQDPPPGQSIPNQGSINLLVSGGPEQQEQKTFIFMPDIRGKGVEEAARILAPYTVTLVPNPVDILDARVDVVLDQDPPPDTLIYEGQVVTYDVKPSGALSLPGVPEAEEQTRYEAKIVHAMNADWYGSDVRVDVIDRHGNRETVWTKAPRFDGQAQATFVAGSAIQFPVRYINQATVEVYVDGHGVASYRLEGGADPVREGTLE